MERRRESLPGERVRPCLRCGALLPYELNRCTDCGFEANATTPTERVRVCLGCDRLLTYDVDPCPSCGAPARRMGEELARVKACIECGNVIPFRQLYCERCGDLSVPLEEEAAVGGAPMQLAPRRRMRSLPEWVALAVAVAALAAAVFALRAIW